MLWLVGGRGTQKTRKRFDKAHEIWSENDHPRAIVNAVLDMQELAYAPPGNGSISWGRVCQLVRDADYPDLITVLYCSFHSIIRSGNSMRRYQVESGSDHVVEILPPTSCRSFLNIKACV